MKRCLRLFGLIVGLSVAMQACELTKIPGCTLMGCSDQVTITVRRADLQPPDLAAQVTYDGRTVECQPPTQAASI